MREPQQTDRFQVPTTPVPLLPEVTAVAVPPTQAASALVVEPTVTLLGVRVTDVTRPRAIELLIELIEQHDGHTRNVFFVNAHTLNLAYADKQYRRVLNLADYVFGDGTGVRWAAGLKGVRLKGNVNGTDLTPELLRTGGRRTYRYFLLGGSCELIDQAARYARDAFPGWKQVGHHHGFLRHHEVSDHVARQINRARPDLLLVGMGNPLQEQWVEAHRNELQVPVCMAVGGLFHYWAGGLRRAPRWLRRLGAEWLGILCRQPWKARRYLLGNPVFLWRIYREKWLGPPATPAGDAE